MSKKHRHNQVVTTVVKVETTETVAEMPQEIVVVTGTQIAEPLHVPRPRAFEPRNCTACVGLRPEECKRQNFSEVYHTRGTVRYCKCRFCGNTWKQE